MLEPITRELASGVLDDSGGWKGMRVGLRIDILGALRVIDGERVS